MKIFVAIPVYDGKLQVQTVKSLLEETSVAAGIGDELNVNFLPNCSVPAQGRNQLVQSFLASDCDKLFFLDADLSWSPGAMLKLAHMPVDFVGGCYRFKHAEEAYPIGWLPKPELWSDKYGLIEVASLPTGFQALSRDLFTKFREAHPGREYSHWGQQYYAYFQMLFANGGLYSEDSYFCKEWRDLGGSIYLDPEIQLSHWDASPVAYTGTIGSWLKTNAGLIGK